VKEWLAVDEMPEWLAGAVKSAWVDLQKDGPLHELQPFASARDVEQPGMYWVGLTADLNRGGNISGGGVSSEFALADVLVVVADNMQHVVSETHEAWAQARPRCPYHPHPMKAVVFDGEAWWICSSSHERLGRIGRGELVSENPTLWTG
jgi:hypothetical protein